MTNRGHHFTMIPDTILSLIFENLTIDEILQKTTTCKQFNLVKIYSATLTLSEKSINHIFQIIKRIKNNYIERIIVKNIANLRDKHVQQLAQLHRIEEFTAYAVSTIDAGISGVGLESICNDFKNLKRLSLSYVTFGQDWINPLKLNYLESFELSNSHVKRNIFKNMFNLRELYLNRRTYVNDYWMDIAKLPNIEKLDISHCRIKNEQFVHITNMCKLIYLNIAYCDNQNGLTDEGFKNIIKLQELRELTMTLSCGFTSQSIITLTGLNQLHKLNITDCDLNDDKFLYITNLIGTNIIGLQELTITSRNKISNNTLYCAKNIFPIIKVTDNIFFGNLYNSVILKR